MRALLPILVALSACGAAMPQEQPPAPERGGGRSPDHSTARDGDVAVREEFAAAEQEGTAAAYRRFAGRHPDHALAAVAVQRAEALEDG